MIICIVSIETDVIKVPDILSFIIAFITDKLYHKFILKLITKLLRNTG